jgi:hypothetical protein
MTPDGVIERLSVICSNVGFDLSDVATDVQDRLVLLAERSQTVSDLERMAELAFGVFRHYDAHRPHEVFDELERRTIVLGCLFSDIGKTGPKRADVRERQLIVDMFSIEAVEDVMQPVSRFMTRYFVADAAERVRRFGALGLDPSMPMRELWNLHTSWTLEIIDGAGVPAEAVAAAATHHMLDNINPGTIVGADDRFTRGFGANTCFDRGEKLVIVLDKYDALRRRGRLSHARAVAWLRERVANNDRFRGDRELETLIADIELLAGPAAP